MEAQSQNLCGPWHATVDSSSTQKTCTAVYSISVVESSRNDPGVNDQQRRHAARIPNNAQLLARDYAGRYKAREPKGRWPMSLNP